MMEGKCIYGDEHQFEYAIYKPWRLQEGYRAWNRKWEGGGAVPNIVALLNSMIPVNTSYAIAVSTIHAQFCWAPLDPFLKATVRRSASSFFIWD